MDRSEKAKLVALARILGCTLPETEIIEKLDAYYESALKQLSENCTSAKVEPIRRPF